MALALYDRVQETTTTAGTGSVTLLGALPGYQSFAVVGNGNTCYYTIVDGSAWEVGIGTYSTTGPTLARTTVLSNSNANTSPITLSGGTSSVFLTYPAEKSVNLDTSGNVSALGTISSGTWQATTVGVSYGGTGVTSSSGANSVVLRDTNANAFANNFFTGFTSTVTSGTTVVLTAASTGYQRFTGTTAQTVQLPNATTLSTGFIFTIDNDSTQTLTVIDNASTTLDTIPSGGIDQWVLIANGTSAGTWVAYSQVPSAVDWGTNTLNLGSTVVSGGTWQGGTVQPGYGGTGLTTFSAANNALYSNSASTLTAGTLPILAGGTGNTTGQAASVANALTAGTGISYSSGTTYNGSAAITINNSAPMVYPGAGIPNSTGTAWGTSYSTTGSGTVVALATSPSFTTPILGTPQSGNFSTGTFTWPTFNQNTTGSAGSVSNAVTFNNSGSGATSGTTYNGSAAQTISYNTIGAPSTTGTNASGTWSINISGNAATATTAANGGVTSATAVAGTGISISSVTTTGAATHTVTNTGVTSVDSTTGAVTLSSLSSFANSLVTSGYQKLPSGLIIQWGVSGTISNGGTTTVTWPISFPTACLFATWGQQSSSHGATTCIVYSWTTTGATLYQGSGSNIVGYYIAIGH